MTQPNSEQQAFLAGQRCAKMGWERYETNPHAPATPEHRAWDHGWLDAVVSTPNPDPATERKRKINELQSSIAASESPLALILRRIVLLIEEELSQ